MIRLAIDPGDKHVGWAYEAGDFRKAGEVGAAYAMEFVERWVLDAVLLYGRDQVELVVEEFVLYPHEAGHQAWSPMRTSEMIGAIKHVAKQQGVPVTEQGAHVKKPTERQMVGRGIESVATGRHAKDAELHLNYRVLRAKEESTG